MAERLDSPVLFLVFNKPETTARVFEAIRKAKPKKLYVAADGPRRSKPGEAETCEKTRQIATSVDWDCRVKTLFRKENLGCRRAVSSAITWFFENEPEGIILEDDCLPSQSFFHYCSALLDRYRDDTRVMHIGANNFQDGAKRGDGSYYFSRYTHIWGWATWRRAWKLYDASMKTFPEFKRQRVIDHAFQGRLKRSYWSWIFQKVYDKKIDTWDYQWLYSLICNNGLAISPNVNLVSNIGFSEGALHTKDAHSRFANMPTHELKEIIHPAFMVRNDAADGYTFKTYFLNPLDILSRRISRLRRKFKFF